MNPPHPNGRVGDMEPVAFELDAQAVARLHELDPGGRNGIVARVMKTFEHSLVSTLSQLQSAEQRGDSVELRRLAHTLKSSSASVGALALSASCAAVEALARDQRLAEMPGALERLHVHGDRALGAVRRLLHE